MFSDGFKMEYKLNDSFKAYLDSFVNDFPEEWKFIVYSSDSELELCADVLKCKLKHKDVAQKFGIEFSDILGGGHILVDEGSLFLNDYSLDFYSVPQEAALGLGTVLQNELNSRGEDIEKLIVTMADKYDSVSKRIWKMLGFKV